MFFLLAFLGIAWVMGDSSDRHKTPRVFASGAQKRKKAAEREKKEEEILAKTPKLTSFFTIAVKPTEEDVSNNPLNEENDNRTNAQIAESIPEPESIIVKEHTDVESTSTKVDGFGNDIGLWPDIPTHDMIAFWANKGSSTLQNCDEHFFEESSELQKKTDFSSSRKCSKHLFLRKNKNNETLNRFWLCFSPSKGKVYCYACKLVATQKIQLSGDGFNDWKHASERISEHENSKNHLEAITILAKLGVTQGRIDESLAREEAEQSQYWRKVLMRVVSTIKFIAERGLAFRGDDELIGSPRNGNFLGILELLAEYDPFLSTHLKEKANKGSGHVNYLSSTICEELIALMGERVVNEIIARVKQSKYYSISVDSTPDEAHIDQLTVVLRYMEGAVPKERFLTFISNCGHTGAAMAKTLIEFLDTHKIDICDCRGQSYDNAANMSGKYNGMQALILEKNKLSVFVPCCGHSLNLVGKAAANSCACAVHFFDFVQNLYVFFTATTERYAILVKKLSENNTKFYVPKVLSETRWSCRADATKAIVHGYEKIKEALADISHDQEQKDVVKIEATRLLKKMGSLEIALYARFWNDILERFNATNKMLQDPKMVLSSAVEALKSLRLFVESKREKFEEYEEVARKLSDTDEYIETRSRSRNVRLNPLDYAKSSDAQLSPKEKFRVGSFIPVIDQLSASLSDRIRAYDVVCDRFGFLNHLENLSLPELHKAADKLVKIYNDDLEISLGNELVQFVALIDAFKKDYNVDNEPKEMFFYRILVNNNFGAAFPNIEITLRMYLVLMVANCSGERSFSKMKIIKNRLRTTMTQKRLANLSLLSIESDLLREIDFAEIINDFASKKARKVSFT